ncbi:MAG: hypothetical protein A3G59_02530 [Candidatus Taylorbacteria bacterium RIFCSPLOWO2_12_FULL_47_20]|uniref:Polysaccharide biosynthesis protein C-terminal domain-containing protein n=2 Tax=Candidatus Tayloriibacteriota TaxID=1817919 RepID=A0A1G2P7Z9_9BACT|nr:MAG: hypothetical protein A3H68_03815 [Candidatus Taylorbacteria bacterium RIFCSPLOWO2_02_FULL_46_40]OHA44476.1 MAG: hypothetical protein A3G59_02530 [Candidatus Taylorbacteria bacterium RIFCSPLOWO2_12_FULL_47_20]
MDKGADFSFSKKFLSGESHYAFWDLVSKGIGLLNTFLIITSLTIYQYGVFQLLLAFYAVLSGISGLGSGAIGNDIMRLVGEGKEGSAKRLFLEYASIRMAAAVLISLAIFVGGDLLAVKYKPDFIAVVRLLPIILLLEVVFTTVKSLLVIRLRFGLVASRSTVYKLAQAVVLSYFFFFSNLSVRGVIISMIAGSVFSTLVLLRPIIKSCEPWRGRKYVREKTVLGIFKSYGKWEVFQQFISKLSSYIQPWAIKFFISTEAVAIYSVAQMMLSVVSGFSPTKTISALVPLKMSDSSMVQKIYTYALKYVGIFLVGLGLAAGLAAGPFVGLAFPKYVVSLPFFYFLLLSIPISVFNNVTAGFLIVFRRQKFLFLQKVIKLVIGIPLYFLLLPLFGLWGMPVQGITVSVVLAVSTYLYVKKYGVGVKIYWEEIFSFKEEDKVFLRNVISHILSSVKNKFSFLKN